MTHRFWVRVRIPEGAAAGAYRSTVRLLGDQAPERRLAAEVRVLPFRAAEADLIQNLYFYHQDGRVSERAPKEVHETAAGLRAQAVRDVVDHLETAIADAHRWWVYERKGGGWAVEMKYAWEDLENFRRAGHAPRRVLVQLQPILKQAAHRILTESEAGKFGKHLSGAPDLPDEYWTAIGDIVEQIDRSLREEGVELALYSPFDEPFGDDLDLFVRTSQVLQERLDDPRIFCNVPPWIYYGEHGATALAPWCNVWWVYGTLTDDEREEEMADGTRLMGRFDPAGPTRARAASGLLRWRRQEVGGNWWSYDALRGSVNTQLDGPTYGDRCMAYPTVPRTPRVIWEATRMGHEDLRYVRTLEEQVDAATGDCGPWRRAGRRGGQVLRALHERIDPTLPQPLDDAAEYDEWRRKVVHAIEDLIEARQRCDAPGPGED